MILTILALLFNLASLCARAAAAGPLPRTIVVIYTDDLAWREVAYLPRLQASLSGSLVFDRYYAVQALCCPSRASLLRGQYPHNHGVKGNNGDLFREVHQDTLATRMHAAGWRTVFAGKYFNHFAGPSPGWDVHDGTGNVDSPLAHSVQVGRAAEIALAQPGDLFLLLQPGEPHSKVDVLPQYKDTEPGCKAGGAENSAKCDTRIRRMYAVEDMVQRIDAALLKSGRMVNATLIFTSDNGLLLGEHGEFGKHLPWDAASRLPMFVRGAGVTPGHSKALVANIDLAPTILDVAGLPPAPYHDGRSFKPLLQGSEVPWRRALLLENSKYVDGLIPALIDATHLSYKDTRYLLPGEKPDGSPSPEQRATMKRLQGCERAACWQE